MKIKYILTIIFSIIASQSILTVELSLLNNSHFPIDLFIGFDDADGYEDEHLELSEGTTMDFTGEHIGTLGDIGISYKMPRNREITFSLGNLSQYNIVSHVPGRVLLIVQDNGKCHLRINNQIYTLQAIVPTSDEGV